MRNIFTYTLLIGLSVCLSGIKKSYAQCACAGTNYGTLNVAGWTEGQSATIATNIYAGERSTIQNTVQGAVYRISSCSASYDTQLSIYTTGCAFVGYNDDNGPACSGNRASVDITSPGGDLYAKLNQFNCVTNSTATTVTVTLLSLPCALGVESNPVCTSPAGCGNCTLNLGAGAYYDITVSANTYYNFSWTNSSITNGFCATPQNGSGASFSTNQTGWFSGSTTVLRIGAKRSGYPFNTTSAVMTYKRTDPTVGSPSVPVVDFCDASGNFTTAVTANGTANGSVVWDYGSNNGAWTNNWVPGTASAVCCFPKKVSNSDGNADRIRYRVTNDGCDATSGTILIRNRYNEAPSSLASSSTSYCSNSVPANITLTATFPSSINMNGNVVFYSGSCGGTSVGTVAPAAGSSTAAVTIAAPAATTTYFVRYEPGAGTGCGNTVCAQVTVTVNPAPTVNAGGAMAAICQGGTSAALGGSVGGGATGGTWSTPAGGTFNPNATTLNATWTPPGGYSGTATLTLTTSGGSCGTTSANKTIQVNPSPTATAGAAMAAICQGGTSGALGGSVGGGATGGTWSTPAGGTFNPNATTLNATWTPPGGYSGTATLTLTSSGGSCGTATDSKTITVNPSPTVNAGGAMAAICQGGTSAALGGSVGGGGTGGTWSTPAGGTFNPNATTLNATWTPPGGYSGTATLTLTTSGGSCGTTSANKTIQVNPSPTATAGAAMAAICQGGTSGALGGSVGGGATGGTWSTPAGGTFNPNATTLNATWTPPGGYSGTATLTLTSSGGSCGTATDSKTITVNAAPAAFTANLITSTPLCFRGNARIDVPAAETGTQYQLRDNVTAVGSAQTGAGIGLTFHTANLTAGSSTYNVLASRGSCTSGVAIPTISVTAAPGTLAQNNDTRTCYVNGNNAYVEFISANGAVLAINPGAQNLGNVTVTEYVAGAPINVQACGTVQPQFVSASLARHWTISSTVAPVGNVNVRLYFADADLTALSTASNANTNPFDNVSSISDLSMTKYSGTNENATFTDNCGTGIITLHPQVGNGGMTVGNVGYGVSASSFSLHTVSSFSELWLAGSGNVSPLPIELTSFGAVCNDAAVTLAWTTASEINNERFVLERSDNLADWKTVGELPGAGNSNQPHSYQFTDERPLNGLSYYRLTQYDYDGASETFPPASVLCQSDGLGNSLSVYPNPADDRFTVSLKLASACPDCVLEISDLTGKRILSRKLSLTDETQEFTFDRSLMNAGQYIIRVMSSDVAIKPVKLLVK